MSTLMLKELHTRRNYWLFKVELYKTADDAKSHGHNLMYEDDEGAVYGIRDKQKIHCWERIAFVPYPEYYRSAMRS